MRILKLLLFRRANKVLEIDLDTNKIKFIEVYTSEEDELEYATSYFRENKLIKSTNGFYSIGLNGDYLGFYIENKKPKILYEISHAMQRACRTDAKIDKPAKQATQLNNDEFSNDDTICQIKIKLNTYENTRFDFLEGEFKCYPINEEEWMFECVKPHNIKWVYQPFVCDPNEDEETDVNFGLWIMQLFKNKNLLERIIELQSHKP